jgi:hypothetical protein
MHVKETTTAHNTVCRVANRQKQKEKEAAAATAEQDQQQPTHVAYDSSSAQL